MEIKVGQIWSFSIDNRHGAGDLFERIISLKNGEITCEVVRCDTDGWDIGQKTKYTTSEFRRDVAWSDGKLFYDFKDYINAI